MDRIDKVLDKLVTMFEQWLEDFETKPVQTGLKAIITLWIVRAVYRSFR